MYAFKKCVRVIIFAQKNRKHSGTLPAIFGASVRSFILFIISDMCEKFLTPFSVNVLITYVCGKRVAKSGADADIAFETK